MKDHGRAEGVQSQGGDDRLTSRGGGTRVGAGSRRALSGSHHPSVLHCKVVESPPHIPPVTSRSEESTLLHQKGYSCGYWACAFTYIPSRQYHVKPMKMV